jgi:DNA repair exonuclease SbcCD ATPase subunit
LYKLKTPKNVYLLENSGIYLYGKNLLFGYTDVYDNETTKINITSERTKIGLWHGTLNASKTCLGETLEGKFNCKDFQDYDYTMLGDIHKFQYLNKEKTIAYCGSLIQQNFGEDRIHGYIKWDLEKKTSEFVNVENNYGFVTVNVKNNEIIKQDYDFSQKTYLRIKYEESNNLNVVIDEISKKTEIISWKYEDVTVGNLFNYENEKTNSEVEKIDNDTVSVERLMKYINEKYEMDNDKKKKIEEKIKETIKSIEYNYDTNKRDIKLKNLSFNNFNIYGENNYIDFEQMKGIMNICGKNATGKSSLIMCICYAIWGYAEDGNIGKYDYVNATKRNMETTITLLINGIEYKIERKCMFKDLKKDTSHFKHNVTLYKNNQDISGKSINEIENQIIEIMGDQTEFKKICIMEQKKNESFLDMSDTDKTKKICNLLKLDIYTIMQNNITQDELLNNKKIKDIEKKVYIEYEGKSIDKCELMIKNIENMEKEGVKLGEEIKRSEEEKNKLEKEKILLEWQIKELKEINYNLIENENNIKNNIELCEKNIEIVTEEITKKEKEKELLETEKNSNEYENIINKYNAFSIKKEEEILITENEIKNLLKEYIKLEDNNLILEELMAEKENIENENNELKKEEINNKHLLEKINNDITKYDNDEKKNKLKYEKYLEYLKNLDEINANKKNILNEIEIVKQKLNDSETEYEIFKNKHKQNQEKLFALKKEMEKYKDIEKKKKDYEDENHKKIEILMEERDKLSKEYENIIITEKPEKKINKKIEDLNLEIEENKNKILEMEQNILQNKKEIKKVSNYKNLDQKIKEYNKEIEKIENIKFELSELNKEKDNCINFLKLFNNHKYNEKCEVCMANDSTKKLITTKNKIELLEKKIGLKIEENKICEKGIKKNEKYNEAKEIILMNEIINKKIDAHVQNIKILNDKNEILKEKIMSLMQIIKNYDAYLEKINKNKIIEVKLEKNKNDIDAIKNAKYTEYDNYIETQQKIHEIKDSIHDLQIKMEDYEKIKSKMLDLNNNFEKNAINKEKILNKIKEKEKYKIMFDKNNENKIQKEKISAIIEKYTISQNANNLKNELITKQIEKYNNYIENHNKNKKIESSIKKKEEELQKIKSSKYETYEKYIIISLELDNCIKYIENKEIEKEKIKNELEITKNIEKEINILLVKKNNLEKYQNELNIINNNIIPIILNYEEMQNVMHILHTAITNKKHEIKYLTDLKNESNEIKDMSSINKSIIEIIKNGFVDDFLTNNVMPIFCNNLNSILNSYVNFGLHMTYNNKKIIVYKKDKNNYYTNALKMSGYESLMTNIAFRLAINNINKLIKTDFFVIDEAFSFCDDDSTSKMQNLFDYMRKIYKYVIVISHNEQIKSYTDTDIIVNHSGGFSKVFFGKQKTNILEPLLNDNNTLKDNIIEILSNPKLNDNETLKKNIIDLLSNEKIESNKINDVKQNITLNKKEKKQKTNLSNMTPEELKEYKRKMKMEWDLKNKEKVSEYNRKKYLEKK